MDAVSFRETTKTREKSHQPMVHVEISGNWDLLDPAAHEIFISMLVSLLSSSLDWDSRHR